MVLKIVASKPITAGWHQQNQSAKLLSTADYYERTGIQKITVDRNLMLISVVVTFVIFTIFLVRTITPITFAAKTPVIGTIVVEIEEIPKYRNLSGRQSTSGLDPFCFQFRFHSRGIYFPRLCRWEWIREYRRPDNCRCIRTVGNTRSLMMEYVSTSSNKDTHM